MSMLDDTSLSKWLLSFNLKDEQRVRNQESPSRKNSKYRKEASEAKAERVRSNLLSGVKCRDGRERSLKMRVEAKADLTELILLIYKYVYKHID